ncbi:MAG: DsrE family protein [Acidiferrobacterales bacterium]
MKKDRPTISDEFLSAFVDNQLTQEEKAAAYDQISESKEINMQICELRKVSDLVRLAYANPPAAPNTREVSINKSFQLNIAACLLAGLTLVLGIVLGWNIGPAQENRAMLVEHEKIKIDHAQMSQRHKKMATSNTAGKQISNNPAPTDGIADPEQIKILIHLNSKETELVQESLDALENVLRYYRKIGQDARIEMVANGDGINLLRKDVSPYPERIKRMQQEYDNLTFVACQNSMNRLKDERGIIARLIPGVVVIDSGMAQLMRRQDQGWAYIRV